MWTSFRKLRLWSHFFKSAEFRWICIWWPVITRIAQKVLMHLKLLLIDGVFSGILLIRLSWILLGFGRMRDRILDQSLNWCLRIIGRIAADILIIHLIIKWVSSQNGWRPQCRLWSYMSDIIWQMWWVIQGIINCNTADILCTQMILHVSIKTWLWILLLAPMWLLIWHFGHHNRIRGLCSHSELVFSVYSLRARWIILSFTLNEMRRIDIVRNYLILFWLFRKVTSLLDHVIWNGCVFEVFHALRVEDPIGWALLQRSTCLCILDVMNGIVSNLFGFGSFVFVTYIRWTHWAKSFPLFLISDFWVWKSRVIRSVKFMIFCVI